MWQESFGDIGEQGRCKNGKNLARIAGSRTKNRRESRERKKVMASLTPLKHDKSTTQNVCLCFSSSSSSSSSFFSSSSSPSSLLPSCLYSLVIAWLFFLCFSLLFSSLSPLLSLSLSLSLFFEFWERRPKCTPASIVPLINTIKINARLD